MIKASNPVVKDGVGIIARLVVIALLLSFLSAMLQGCNGNVPAANSTKNEAVSSYVQKVNVPLMEQLKLNYKIS